MNKKKWFFGILMLTGASMLLIQSCVKDNFDFKKITTSNLEWNPNLAVPIVDTKITLNKVLQDVDQDNVIFEDDNHLLYLIYGSEVASVTAEKVIVFNNQSFSESIIVPVTTTQSSINLDVEKDFSVSNFERIDSMTFKSGQMLVNITSTFEYPGYLYITYPSIKKDGIPLRITVPISPANGSVYTQTVTEDSLRNYRFDLSTTGSTNKFPVNYQIQLNSGGAPINVGEGITIDVSLKKIKYKSVYGFLGNQNLSIDVDTVYLDLFKNAFAGNIYFEDPRLNISINNSFGLPVEVEFPVLGAYSAAAGTGYDISMPATFSPLNIVAPTLAEVGAYKLTSEQINAGNSNVKYVLSNLPKYIYYSVNASLNKNISDGSNFVLDTSKFKVHVEMELPMHGSMLGYSIQDTANFNIANFYQNTDQIEFILFKMSLNNAFPVDGTIQGYFCDSLYNRVDSLFEDRAKVFKSGVIDSGGKVSQPTMVTNEITFNKDRINDLKDVRHIIFQMNLRTTGDGATVIKFYSTDNIALKFGMQAKLNLKAN